MFKDVWEKIRQWFEDLLAGFGPELIVNGSFEEQSGHPFPPKAKSGRIPAELVPGDTSIDGWQVDPNPTNHPGDIAWFLGVGEEKNTLGYTPANGRLFVDLTDQGHSWTPLPDGSSISGGVLSNFFTTVPGRHYQLKMRIGTYEVKDPSGDPAVSSGPVAVWIVTGGNWVGRLDHRGGDPGSKTVWVTRSMVFMALNTTTAVVIHGWLPPDLIAQRMKMGKAGIGNPTFIGLDYVSVRMLWRWVPPWLLRWAG